MNGKVDALHGITKGVNDGIAELRTAMANVARLEVRHQHVQLAQERAMNLYEKLETRVDLIEKDMPGLKETRGDVRKVQWIVGAAVITALLGLVLVKAGG